MTHTAWYTTPYNDTIPLNGTLASLAIHTAAWDRLGWHYVIKPIEESERWCKKCGGVALVLWYCAPCMTAVSNDR